MPSLHIMKAFEQELTELDSSIARMAPFRVLGVEASVEAAADILEVHVSAAAEKREAKTAFA